MKMYFETFKIDGQKIAVYDGLARFLILPFWKIKEAREKKKENEEQSKLEENPTES